MRPQVEYASTIWSPYTKQNTQKIEMIQRRAAARWVKKTTQHRTVSRQCLIILVGDPLKTDTLIPACSCTTELCMAMYQYTYQHILINASDLPIKCTLSRLDRSTPIGILGRVWFLIVSTSDFCTLTYFTTSSSFTQQQLLYGINSPQIVFSTFLNLVLNLTLH